MSLSSDSLIHITDKDSLYSILNSGGFLPSFCEESIILKEGELPPVMFAMVCFCDIPFHNLEAHMKLYSKKEPKSYGIGLTKEWGVRNGLNPVFYLQEESSISDVLFQRFEKLINDGVDKELIWDFMKLFGFIKQYEGKNLRFDNPKYRYYDEREWRWVPPISKLNGNLPFVRVEKYNAKKSEYKKLLKAIKLPFEHTDIRYIIINDESDREEMIEFLEKNFTELDDREMKNLITKITTNQYIKKDS